MIRSMTGYGKSLGDYEGNNYTIEIKSLNSRNADLRLKLPGNFKSRELDVRNIVVQKLKRGKIDLIISNSNALVADNQLNMALIQNYYDQLSAFARKNKLDSQDYIQSILRIPNVLQSEEYEIDDSEWNFVSDLLNLALDHIDQFRIEEGRSLESDFAQRIKNIETFLHEIPLYEDQRRQDLISKMNRSLEDGLLKEQIDHNRFEQELVYYLERLDIHEEKIRLTQHCKFFMEALEEEDDPGKKLNFITQEIGREINTIGSKAQYTAIQKLVVSMKVELDQIKEQMANIL